MKQSLAGQMAVLVFCSVLLLFSLTPSLTFAEEGGRSVADAIKNGNMSTQVPNSQQSSNNESLPADSFSSQSSGWSFFFQVIFSLGLIIVLIYLLLRFLGSKQLGNFHQKGPIKVISSASVGNGKSVQLVMIADSLYILGVGDNVNLIRYVENGDEADLILSEVEMQPMNKGVLTSIFPFLKKHEQQEEELIVPQERISDSFEQLLEKKWDEVKHTNAKPTNWTDRENEQRGERL
ncbi:flagellar biosynthetic protein FliO [Brevibacillus sp. SYSU BS000544]|uniref:flagellar biosynthetic protein FliO n=1 Tax=Brevibacillus sp. SYSU BS000544 TaxID=3416443 RepID=UPI003CE4AD75